MEWPTNWWRLASPSAWWERAGDVALKLSAPDVNVPPERLTWPVEKHDLDRMAIHWPEGAKHSVMGKQLVAAFRRFVHVEIRSIPQPHRGCISITVVIDGEPRNVVIEISDFAPLDEDAYKQADLHFKMEYSKEGYGERLRLLPGGYINGSSDLYAYLPYLRRMRDSLPPRFQVYGRYSLSMEKRRKPLKILHAATGFRFTGGEGKVRYRKYLEEVARSQICIDLPSMSSITWRMVELLAVGSCIVGPPHTNRMQVPFVDRVHVAYCRPDYSDLEEVCMYYLENEDKARELVRNSREFFDTYLHRDQLAMYYLYHCLKALA